MRADSSGPAWGLPPLPERFSTRLDVPLVGDIDLDGVLATVEHHSLKGLFFTRYVDEAWAAVHEQLVEPPANGKYHAFEAYPMRDYLRLFDFAARARFPGSVREAFRLLGRSEIEVFAGSTFGKVTLAMLGDAGAALLRYPDVLSVVSKGPVARSERLGPKQVKISFDGAIGSVEHVLGILEGLSLAFEASPSVDVQVDELRRASLAVSW